LRNLKRVGGRLANDAHAQPGAAIGAQHGLARIGAQRHICDIAEPHPVVDVEILEAFRGGDVSGCADDDVGGLAVREPAGTSSATLRKALRRSASVRPKAARRDWSMSTRKIFSRSP
jgi:hypothetical protein